MVGVRAGEKVLQLHSRPIYTPLPVSKRKANFGAIPSEAARGQLYGPDPVLGVSIGRAGRDAGRG